MPIRRLDNSIRMSKYTIVRLSGVEAHISNSTKIGDLDCGVSLRELRLRST